MACIEKYKAPNGKFSKLHDLLSEEMGMWRGERVYLEVHDDTFKEWFGDWESKAKNNLTNQSLIGGMDENWEPRVFWYGGNTDDIKGFNKSKNFFTTTKESAQKYAVETANESGGDPVVYPVFIKIRQQDINEGLVEVSGDTVIVDGKATNLIKSIESDGSYSKSNRIFESLPLEDRPKTDAINVKDYIRKLGDSSALLQAPKEGGKEYTYQGRSLLRVSSWVDKDVPYRGDDSGVAYAQEGTRFHKIVELIVANYTDKEIDNALVESKLPPVDKHEEAFRDQARHFISRLRETGHVMAEIRVADFDKNIAGSIDIIHIKDNGHADIYDLKAAHETPWKRNPPEGKDMSKHIWDVSDFDFYKAERYSVQTVYYSKILGKPDPVTGRPGIIIDNIYAVPLEVYRDKYDEVSQVTMLPHVNIKEWKNGSKSFYEYANRVVNYRLQGTPVNTSIEGRKNSPGDSGEIIKQALGININAADSIDKRSIDFVEKHGSSSRFNLGDNTSIPWVSDDKTARVEQIKAIYRKLINNHAANMTSGIEAFFNGEYKNPKEGSQGAIFTFKRYAKEEGLTARYARTARLQKILNFSNAKEVSKLSDIPGFEQYNDVMLVKRGDGAYDLLTFTDVSHDLEFDVKNKTKNFVRKIRTDGENIFGNHLSPYDAENAGITLRNNFGDFTKLRLGVIALELQNANPQMRVNRLVVDEINSTSTVSSLAVTLDDITPEIKQLTKIENIKGLLPDPLVEVIEKAGAGLNITGIDSLNNLHSYLVNQISDPFADKLSKEIERFSRNEITKDEIADQLLNGVNGLRSFLKRKNANLTDRHQREALSTDPYFMALATAWVTLKGHGFNPETDVTDEFLGQISYWVKTPTHTGRKTLDKFFDLFRQRVDNVKREIQKFVNLKEPIFRDLVAEDPFVKKGIAIGNHHVGGSDAVFAMTRTVMEPLIKTGVDKNGNKFYTPFLKDENDPSLTPAQKRAIKFFNDQVQEAAPGKWSRGQIPIIKVSSSTKWYRAKDKITKGKLRDAMNDTKDAMSTFVAMAAKKGNFQTLSDSSRQYQDVAFDQFAGQTHSDGVDILFSTKALDSIGLNSEMTLVDPELNGSFETDLEKVLTLFRAHYIKKAEMDKALPIYHVYRSIFKYYELAHGLEQSKTIEMIDDYVADIVFNTKIAEDALLSKVLNVSMRISSIGLLGLNPNVFIGNGLQMSIASITDALTNTITSDPRFPGIKAWGKATARMTAAMKDQAEMIKMILMRQRYLPEDITVLTGDKYQMTSRGMINEQLAYALDRSMETGWRTHHLIAQMEKDGVYEAHTIVKERDADGNERWVLKYDPKLDPRFKGADGQLFYEAIKQSMRDKGELDINEEITGAYDWKLRERLKAYINQGIGTFDKDLSSPWARHGLMFTLSQFRNWFTNKFQRITKLPYDAEIFGDYVKVGDKIVWSSEPMKGLLWTLTEMHSIIYRLATGQDVSLADKRNLAYITTSTAAAVMLAVLSAALIADDDDDDFIRLKSIVSNNIKDTLAFVNGGPFATILTSPAVFASYFSKLFDSMGIALLHGMEGDTAEMWNTAVDIFPIVNKFPQEWIHLE